MVVGINSGLGSEIFKKLISNGEKVTGTSRSAQSLNDKNVIFLDLENPNLSSNNFENDYDYVYLFAGMTSIKDCEANRKLAYKINVDGVKKLTKVLANKTEQLIFISSSQVFNCFTAPGEGREKNPLNAYGEFKSIVEDYLLDKYGYKSKVIRLTKVLDLREDLVYNWIRKLRENEDIEVFTNTNIAPIYYESVVQNILEIRSRKNKSIFHITPRDQITYYDFATYLKASLGSSSTIIPITAESDFSNGIRPGVHANLAHDKNQTFLEYKSSYENIDLWLGKII